MRIEALLSVLALSLLAAACTVSPTGRQQLMMMSPQQMDAMGTQAFAQMKRSQPLAHDARAEHTVRCIADALIRVLPDDPRRWEIAVFQDRTPNAFALPGAKIGVNTGMLATARTPDQLAAVIGHEIGHVLAQHANERASQKAAVGLGLQVAQAAAGASGGVPAGTMELLGLGAQVGVLLPFSREHESEADTLGLALMARAGYDPRQAVALWQAMGANDQGAPPEFLSTHPSDATRIRQIAAKLPQVMPAYEQARARGLPPKC